MGDNEECNKALKASSRSTAVLLGGCIGFIVAGPAGGKLGGIFSGIAMDGITTLIESSNTGEFRPNGMILVFY
jgi:hypothetical protein